MSKHQESVLESFFEEQDNSLIKDGQTRRELAEAHLARGFALVGDMDSKTAEKVLVDASFKINATYLEVRERVYQ